MAGVALGGAGRGAAEFNGSVAVATSGTFGFVSVEATGVRRGTNDSSMGMIVSEQAGKGVISVGVSVTETLLAVTVTSNPSVTVT
jgi:hypothetical protein